MSLEEIADWLSKIVHEGAHLRLDSRKVNPGDVFVAVPGGRVDGRNFIRVAAARGAAGVIYEADEKTKLAGERYPVPALAVENLSEHLGEVASAFYKSPSYEMKGVAVTGTNGKTTTTYWISEMLSRTGTPCAVLGTVGCTFAGRHFDVPSLTTPDAVSLQGVFADLRDAGAKAFAVEASSIGLLQGRMTGTRFDTVVFTNLTRDHLDYHLTMENYGDAKAILFAWPGIRHAVVNADDPFAERMSREARKTGAQLWVTGTKGDAGIEGDHTLLAENLRAVKEGTAFDLAFDGKKASLTIPQVGFFNVSNLLEAMGVILADGADFEELLGIVTTLTPPPGRMQLLTAEGMPMAVVDYSHTPDALQKAIESLRPVAQARGGRLVTVFGCGGDRDKGKRPVMGKIAATLSDEAILTSDNPRTEDPAAIIADVLAGAVSARVIEDRREAIFGAVSSASAEDVILVAGKGHEDYQEINGVRHHFSDVEVIREAFNEGRVRYLRGMEK